MSPTDSIEQEISKGQNVSIINIMDLILDRAINSKSSDIHIDPTPDYTRVRMRIDGLLQDIAKLPKNIHQEIIARVKVLSRLRTDEHQAAQDGRFRYKEVDIRVSIVPTYHGENSVMRLLSDHAADFTLDNLGFSENDKQKITKALKSSHGMILATGPTGSGKTTTLYTLLKMINSPDISIITIEDPIEYAVNNIEQIQVNPRSGLSFANGLRSILRQDPDVIMVGEIRDKETAQIAVNCALTGHLLLSTLHTNDAATTLPRLLDMGIEEYLVASTVSIAIAQRLVRKICKSCGGKKSLTASSNNNCEKCNGCGYSGRVSINEVLVINDEIREAILKKHPASEIKKLAERNGMTDMIKDGYEKAKLGITTIEEVLRVTNE
jgi:type II secretory ATPase GspE/PulE/Tfp pilus assembly ATPase PilB-like protein